MKRLISALIITVCAIAACYAATGGVLPPVSEPVVKPFTGVKAPPPPNGGGVVRPPVHYIPHVYGFSNYNPNKNNTNTNIQNTYIYNNVPSSNTAPQSSSKQENSNVTVSKTQSQLDEEERQALRKKYSSILSNSTMSNERMCSKMAEKYKNSECDEMDRVLNNILKLNCDIQKVCTN